MVDALGDVVVELSGEGDDRVIALISHTLGAALERLSLSGTADLNGTGNTLANRLDGNAGANILDGGEGNDAIYGLAGDDALMGGDGHDTLNGGLGADSLEGGLDADIFRFGSAVEANGDVIADFSMTEGDRIDLRRIDANADAPGGQAFTWIGSAVFRGAAGELRFDGSVLEGDVGGDGTADFQITLSGAASLRATDIWL